MLVGNAEGEAPVQLAVAGLDQDGGTAGGETQGNDVAIDKGHAFVSVIVYELSADPHLTGVVCPNPQVDIDWLGEFDVGQGIGTDMLVGLEETREIY